jgi:hypothetical protein
LVILDYFSSLDLPCVLIEQILQAPFSTLFIPLTTDEQKVWRGCRIQAMVGGCILSANNDAHRQQVLASSNARSSHHLRVAYMILSMVSNY